LNHRGLRVPCAQEKQTFFVGKVLRNEALYGLKFFDD
jgi:hypothetical protein